MKTEDRTEVHSTLDAEAIDRLFASIGNPPRDAVSPIPRPLNSSTPAAARPADTQCSSHPIPRRNVMPSYVDKPRSWRDWIGTAWLVGCLVIAAFCFLMAMPNSPLRKTSVGTTIANVVEQPRVRTRDIQDFDVGMRAMGQNPLLEQIENAPEPDPETSRKLVLRMTKESGRLLLVKLLRSLNWIEAVGAKEGGTFFLDLPEMGAVGDAYVEAILPCPPIEDGPGNVVTGVFAHEADPDTVILSVTFANGAHIKGVTDNHPFFSVNENDFVEIGKMHEGDYVKVNGGTTRITKIDSRYARPGEMLYNLETHNQHVYQVTTAGILVHNTCGIVGVTDGEAAALARALRGIEVDGKSAVKSIEAFGSRAGSTFRGRPPHAASDLDVFVTLDSSVVNSAAKRAEVLRQLDEVSDLWGRSKGFPLQIVEEIDVLADSVKAGLKDTPFIPLGN